MFKWEEGERDDKWEGETGVTNEEKEADRTIKLQSGRQREEKKKSCVVCLFLQRPHESDVMIHCLWSCCEMHQGS